MRTNPRSSKNVYMLFSICTILRRPLQSTGELQQRPTPRTNPPPPKRPPFSTQTGTPHPAPNLISTLAILREIYLFLRLFPFNTLLIDIKYYFADMFTQFINLLALGSFCSYSTEIGLFFTSLL